MSSWGIQRRDLRAIGAHLAVRGVILAGNAYNTVQVDDARRAALRHAGPNIRPAVDRYARVVDPIAQLSAQLAELNMTQLDQVRALVSSFRA